MHESARALCFNWSDGNVAYYDLFRARMFDNRRDSVRRYHGDIIPAPPNVPRGDPRRATIESASRFNSQVPLEYAYATWGQLPVIGDARRLAPFRSVDRAALLAFAARRVEALRHIEGWVSYKSTRMSKPALRLPSLTGAAPVPDLAQSLI